MHSASGKPGLVIAVAALAAFLATFNETFLNVAFSPIMTDLEVSVTTVQWLASAYMLGAAVMIPVSAFAYRSIPTRTLFLFSVALLTAGSIIGALAPDFTVLLAGRIVQSLGTGLLIPVGMNMTLHAAPRDKIGLYMGIMGAMTTLGPSLSIISAGMILSFFSWHMLLWVFAGLTVMLFICGMLLPDHIADITHPRLDAASVVLGSFALIGILYGISASFGGDIRAAAASLAAGAVMIVLFIRRQKRIREPLLNMDPLSSASFAAGTVINMIALVVIFGMNIVLPVFLQGARGASSFDAALILFPAIILSCAIAPFAGRIYDRHGAGFLLPAGFACIGIFSAALACAGHLHSLVLLALLYIPVICGSALVIGPVQSFALSQLKHELAPHGITIMSTGFQIAGCIGSSLFTGVYFAYSLRPGHAAAGAFTSAALLAALFALAGIILSSCLKRFSMENAGEPDESGMTSLINAEPADQTDC